MKKLEDLKHIEEVLRKDIEQEKKKLNYLESLTQKIFSYRFEMEYRFECPEKFPNPVCIDCKYALPRSSLYYTKGKNYYMWKYPGEIIKDHFDGDKQRYCIEWEKKVKHNACGCGGEMSCGCGYWEDFCFMPSDNPVCPYCGKTVKVTRYKPLTSFKEVEEFVKEEKKERR